MGVEKQIGISEQLITTRELSRFLNMPEKDIIDAAGRGEIPHYRVAGEFLRFKKSEIIKVRYQIQKKYDLRKPSVSFGARFSDFLYFYDFYILSFLLIFLLVVYIFKP